MNKYDIVIVGSGPTAYGALSSINNDRRVLIISPGMSIKNYNLDSVGDKSYINAFGGGLDYWHGVTSCELFKNYFPNYINHFIDFFNKEYSENIKSENLLNENMIYIPFFKINKKKLLSNISIKNCDVLVDSVEVINPSNNHNTVIIKTTNTIISADRVFLCAGAFGTAEILEKSNLASINTNIGNHINGYCNFNHKSLNKLEIINTKRGHLKKINIGTFNSLRYLIHERPAFFDIKNKDNLRLYKTVYSRKSSDVIKKIILSKSPGLILESLYNRFGILGDLVKDKNSYFQIESTGVYKFLNGKLVRDGNSFDHFVKTLQLNSVFKNLEKIDCISGIHFYDTLKLDSLIGSVHNINDWDKKIIVGDASVFKSIGASHPTFSIMAMNNLALSKIYE